ncbi:acetyl xylan esterase [Hymenobacter sp. UV11]|uniref:SGNH/GDSL hydrolase family protein n=1 Tax=Hymenobacter sp. UV11 TaxID=1849735 RepID=UPI0010622FC6|nr:SGNH/GDSL hydrolase family protein [Hymenobacter sp. UV11]TDN40414.1 acetyl xylan esterase [Hymenobacter sp. UV11]TFZ66581.1 acetyl xylan esterase [Hymenobacter sp. UV11]
MKKILLAALLAIVGLPLAGHAAAPKPRFFAADNPKIQYTGRVDFSDAKKPRFWAPGVYLTVRFRGPSCTVQLADEVLYGKSHNYVQVVVDGQESRRKLTGPTNTLVVAEGLANTDHTLIICKDTEAGIGYLEFTGLTCAKLLPPPPRPARKIEFIGNSITCGYGADMAEMPCGKGEWYDQHNAYQAYGPRTARALGAEWHLTAESGIGLIHSCCDKKNLMPQEFATTDLRVGGRPWEVQRYQPDLVTICLGQNDGVQDSVQFCSAYLSFLKTLRADYPKARLVCLTSPMADARLTAVLRRYLTGVVAAAQAGGEQNIDKFFFARSYNAGCGAHPSLAEQTQIGDELTAYLRQSLGW